MTSLTDDQWHLIDPPATMALYEPHAAPDAEPKIEVSVKSKPIVIRAAPENPQEAGNEAFPKPERKDVTAPFDEPDEWVQHEPRGRHYRAAPRRWSPSPVRIYQRPPVIPNLSSSAQLLSNINYDGIADLPYRSSIYLSTFPFADRDVKKWTWLFANGIEEQWLTPNSVGDYWDDEDEDMEEEWFGGRRREVRIVRNRRRDRSPFINDFGDNGLPSVFLSRALDTNVIPDGADNVRFLVVVRSRTRNGSVKLMTADSRKAAGMVMYYEALIGNSIAFVGAVVGEVGKKTKKFKRVENVEEAKGLTEAGIVGVIC